MQILPQDGVADHLEPRSGFKCLGGGRSGATADRLLYRHPLSSFNPSDVTVTRYSQAAHSRINVVPGHQVRLGTASDLDLGMLLAAVGKTGLDLLRQTAMTDLLWAIGKAGFELPPGDASGAVLLSDPLQPFGLLPQRMAQFPQDCPRPALVTTHRGSRLTLVGLRPGRFLPRFPAPDQLGTHGPMLGCPVVAHGFPLIVGFARL